MTIDFTSFLNNFAPLGQSMPLSSTQTSIYMPTFSPGYVQSMYELIVQKMLKTQSTSQNSLLDYSYLESDPNFSKSAPATQNDLNKMMSQFGTSTQLVYASSSQAQILGISEYFPTSMNSMLFNINSMLGAQVDSTPSLQQDAGSKIIGAGILADLLLQVSSGGLQMNQLLLLYNTINKYFVTQPSIQNTEIASLLPTTVGNILPETLQTILSNSPQYADTLEQSFSTQPQIDAFSTQLDIFIIQQSALPVSSFVTPSLYNNVQITIFDPFGINVQNQLSNQLINSFSNNLTTFLTAQNVLNISDMQNAIMTNFKNILSVGIQSKGLPRISTSIIAVNNEVFNNLGIEIMSNLNILVSTIFVNIGAVLPAGTNISSIDHLFNLHRNLSTKITIELTNDTITNSQLIDQMLLPYFAPGTYNSANIAAVFQKLEAFSGR
jgi:hypothetical protein